MVGVAAREMWGGAWGYCWATMLPCSWMTASLTLPPTGTRAPQALSAIVGLMKGGARGSHAEETTHDAMNKKKIDRHYQANYSNAARICLPSVLSSMAMHQDDMALQVCSCGAVRCSGLRLNCRARTAPRSRPIHGPRRGLVSAVRSA